MNGDTGDESAAIRERYARRAELPADRYSVFGPDVLRRAHDFERGLVRLLAAQGIRDLDSKSVLEIGCGEGINLLQLIRLGFNPARLTGNDLREHALTVARRILPASVRLIAGEASGLDFNNESFDIVVQSTVFSSILDDAMQASVAARMWALTRPGGAVLWYDLARDNPWNRDVRGVPLARIHALFPQAQITARRITLAPPIARAAPWFYGVLDALPFLRSHLLCWIAKR